MDIKEKEPGFQSGKYKIVVDSTIKNVSCDMSTDGGGWTVGSLYHLTVSRNFSPFKSQRAQKSNEFKIFERLAPSKIWDVFNYKLAKKKDVTYLSFSTFISDKWVDSIIVVIWFYLVLIKIKMKQSYIWWITIYFISRNLQILCIIAITFKGLVHDGTCLFMISFCSELYKSTV